MAIGTRKFRVRIGNAAVAFGAAAFACVGPTVPPPKPPPPVTTLIEPTGEGADFSVGQRCNAKGVELCFDAIDDNCNGLVDEGCGLATGALQIVVAWENAFADVELEVTDPAGELAKVGRLTASGLTKDRDCPGQSEDCGGQNVEVVSSVAETLPFGRYRVTLRLERPPTDGAIVQVQIGGHIGPDPLSGKVELSPRRPRISVELQHAPAASRVSQR